MAERFVSPGVYTQERDFSFYVSSVGEPALGLIGETTKGPAFEPTLVQSMGEFRELFGGYDTSKFLPYAANSWFKNANQAIVVRVLADTSENTWNVGTDHVVYLTASGNGEEHIVAAVLMSGAPGEATVTPGTVISGGNQFTFVLSSSTDELIYSGGVALGTDTAPNSVFKLFPATSASTTSTAIGVLDVVNGHELPSSATSWSAHVQTVTTTHPYGYGGYSAARTPTIVSQIANPGDAGTDLFTIHTRSAGFSANGELKVAIENIDPAAETFDIVVREFDDTNSRQVVLERFTRLSMTQSATTYIEKAIGDSLDGSGDYEPISKYIWVEVEDGDLSGLVPAGFKGVTVPAVGSVRVPSFPYATTYDPDVATSRQYLGVDFTVLNRSHVMFYSLSPWDLDETVNVETTSGFHLDSGASASYVTTSSGLTDWSTSEAKMLVPVLGGRDGWSRTESRDFLSVAPSTSQRTAWETAIDELSNPEEYNMNVLALPGVSVDSTVGLYAQTMVEDRADTLYVADMPKGLANATAAAALAGLPDSNYVATYWPYVQIFDADNQARVWIPPTPQALEAIAYTDSVAYPWWAPAGLNRGLTDVIRAEYRLTQADRDELYEGKINPIATFPSQGVAIWGQKTLQTRSTSLDRINVRRMLLYVRKVIAGAAKFVVFEPNDEATRDRLQAIIQPVLDLVRIKRGLEDFRIIIDESVNTPEVIDRGQIIAQIFLKPTKAAETIVLYFNITAQGVEFEE